MDKKKQMNPSRPTPSAAHGVLCRLFENTLQGKGEREGIIMKICHPYQAFQAIEQNYLHARNADSPHPIAVSVQI